MQRPYAVISMNNEDYKPLQELTWDKNKVPYCLKWGYSPLFFPIGERSESSKQTEGSNQFFGFGKIRNILNVLQCSDYEWVLFSECDAMITNFGVSLESLVDNQFHVLLSSCFNTINAGNLMVRNTVEGCDYLKFILDSYPKYKTAGWAEQQCMIDSLSQFKSTVKVVPQRTFNSYDDFLYVLHKIGDRRDKFGLSGEWQSGDFQVHWPGMNLDQRLELARKYADKVVNS